MAHNYCFDTKIKQMVTDTYIIPFLTLQKHRKDKLSKR